MGNTKWTAADLPAFDGRTVVITGGNGGLGYVTARELASAGAQVVLAVRNVRRGEAAAREMPGDVEVRQLDLADLASIRTFADDWHGDIDVLINNAGIMMVPHGHTHDGFERQLGTNHLGHFALTNLLLPYLTDRVVMISSQAHRRGVIGLDDLNWERRPYNPAGAYAQSKLANLLFTLELQSRLPAGQRALAAHPGWSATKLQSHTGNLVTHTVLKLGNALIAQSADAGAWPVLYAASADLPPASYAGPDGIYEYRGHPTLVGRSAAASDRQLAAQLWSASEQLTGVRFPAAA